MSKLKSFIIPFIVFIIIFTFFISQLEIIDKDGKYEKEIFTNSGSERLLEIKAIKDNIAAISVDNEVLLLKEGDVHVIEEGNMEYAGSIKIVKINKDSVIIAFDIYKTDKYFVLIFLCFLFALFIALLVKETIKLGTHKKIDNYKVGDKIKIIDVNCIVQGENLWQNGDIVEIKRIEFDGKNYTRLDVWNVNKTNSEYIYLSEFHGIKKL